MAELSKDFRNFTFGNIQLFKDQSLGIGSYGAVCKAKCDDLICAAKILHPTLFDPTVQHEIAPHRTHRLPIRRFEQECEFMSAIRHPNIVQYLATFRDPDTHLPVLVMELMDDNLSHFLQMSPQPVHYHIQVNISHDISLALAFLHSNNVIHRDLSSNNVLLIGNLRAKVTDFGMARLDDLSSLGTLFTNTTCPGTDVYMPPEAVQDKPEYTEKLDCFSLGVIIVQILTRQFPKPGDRFQEVKVDHPDLPIGKVLVRVSEINRRQNHIREINPNHPLLSIITDCLKDNGSERPSACQISERLIALKETAAYDESMRSIKIRIAENGCNSDSVNKDNDTCHQLPQIETKQVSDSESEKKIYQLTQQLNISKETIAQLMKQITELEKQIAQVGKPTSIHVPDFKLKWRSGKRAPCKMNRWSDATVNGSTVYIRNSNTREIYAYNATSDDWTALPDCPTFNCSIVFINSRLTTVGGNSHSKVSNELFSLSGECSSGSWDKHFPPMPTKRQNMTALCTEDVLIVAGGSDGRMLSAVEVMDIGNHQWSIAVDLPEPLEMASVCICEDRVYVLGAYNSESAYSCMLESLILSCHSEACLKNVSKTWSKMAKLPFSRSTCVSLRGQLLAICGRECTKPTSAIYRYDLAEDAWTITDMTTMARYDCFSAVTGANQTLVVIGGYVDDLYTQSDMVELAQIV